MGQLIPVGMVPVLPGDIMGHKTDVLLRVSPLAAPVMHQVDVRVHHFKVAYRTLWDGWENFITGGEDGMNTDTLPTQTATSAPKSLFDYLGVPPVEGGPELQNLPIRAFNSIYNEFYSDQDLVPEREIFDTTIPQVAWPKDYYTTARPFSAKGPSVSIPVGDLAPVKGIGMFDTGDFPNADNSVKETGASGSRTYAQSANTLTVAPDNMTFEEDPDNPGFPGIFADLSAATGADPLDVRRAWGIQRFMENAARFGSRYPEKMRQLGSLYKGLMDRPEFLAGGSKSINFSEVLQTGPELAGEQNRDFGVGDLYGHGIAAMRSNKYARRVDEHGLVMTMLSVVPKSIYQDGVHREWIRKDREDFHDPYLEFIGQQEIQLNELFLDAANTEDTVFGFSDKYQEYRGHPSMISAEFRDTLDYWHLARKFDEAPVLNQSFTDCVPSKRIHNEQTQDSLWIMVHHKIACHRNISKSATPRLI